MNNEKIVAICLALFGVCLASFSQILLKTAAIKKYAKVYKEYLNLKVIIAYCFFFLSTICSVLALRILPLSLSPIWNASGYIFVTFLSVIILKEKVSKRKWKGLLVIIVGIFIFSL